MAFLRNLLATILGLFIFSMIAFFVFIGILGVAAQDEIPVVEEESVLWLPLNGVLKERTVEDPLEDLFPGSSPQVLSLFDLLDAINEAKEDPNIEGIYLEPMYLSAGFASLKEIRDALVEFKESGKWIYAYGEFISESDFYVASVADGLFLHPQGNLEFNGLSANVSFYKGLFDKLEIEPEIFRVGTFKGAIEPLIRKDLSDENRLQLTSLLSSVNKTYLDEVAISLSIPKDELEVIQNQMKAQVPEDMEDLGLVTRIAHEDEVKEIMMEELALEEVEDINFISFRDYAKTISSEYSTNRVAVIAGEGEIVMSGDENEYIVGAKFAREIRKARESKKVKAIVVRINSPGGSITASDMIWREVEKTRGVKPIIASMGTYAASGGYYMAMACDTIVAQPNTITGSIGIFSVLFNVKNFLGNKLGITNDVVNTGEFSDLITVTRSLNEQERAIFQKGVDRGYEAFISKVSEGRGMAKERVLELAQGRVWSGEQALERGLVDVNGSLQDAIAIAAEKADLEDYKVSYYPRLKPFFEQLMSQLGNEAKLKMFGSEGKEVLESFNEIQKFAKSEGIQARLLGDIEIY